MNRLVFTAILLLFFSSSIFSQPSGYPSSAPRIGTISGKLVEKGSNTPLEYANVAIYSAKDSSLAGGGIADSKGLFSITNLAPGKYYLDAKFIGFEHTKISDIKIGRESISVDLGILELIPASENLGEVSVYAQEKPIAYEIDKKIVDPSHFPTAANGTAVDVLANTPSVSVDIEGNVSLRGSSNFTVLIDGRPTPFSASDALEQIPASTIRTIEIITNPSAKFDPDGNAGIININLKKTKMTGISGIVNATGDTYGSLSGDFLLNLKTGKFNFFLGGNLADRRHGGEFEMLNKTFGEDTLTTISVGENDRARLSRSLKAGVDFFINDYNTISFSGNINGRSNNSGGVRSFQESSTNGYLLNTLTKSYDFGDGLNYSFSLDYKKTFEKKGQEFTAYLFYRSGQNEDNSSYDQFINDTIFYKGQKDWEIGTDDDVRFKLDYVHPITDKMKFETGFQSRLGKSFEWNDVHWYSEKDDYTPSSSSPYYTDSDHRENIHSIYATFSNGGKVFGYQLGLRSEYTDRQITYSGSNEVYGIDRWDFFPTAHLSFHISDKHQLTTSYTRRIQRPRGWFLEPFKTYTDAYNIRQGNPALEPEYIDSYEMGYQFQLNKGFISAEIYHRQTNNKIENVRSVYAENVMLQTFSNIGTDYSTGVEFMGNYNITKWWVANLMGNLYNYRIKGQLYGNEVDQSSINWHARLSNTFIITKTTKIQVDGMYNSPTTSAQGNRDGFAFTNIAVRQDLFKNKLNITLSVRDVLNTAKFGFESTGPNFYSKSKMDMRSPIVSLTLSYKINNYRQQRKNGENGERIENGGSEMMEYGAEGME